jgi:hypothetical protein
MLLSYYTLYRIQTQHPCLLGRQGPKKGIHIKFHFFLPLHYLLFCAEGNFLVKKKSKKKRKKKKKKNNENSNNKMMTTYS